MKFTCRKEDRDVEVASPEFVRLANGRPAATAKCPRCATRMFVFVKETDIPPSLRGKLPTYTSPGGKAGKSKTPKKPKGSKSKSKTGGRKKPKSPRRRK